MANTLSRGNSAYVELRNREPLHIGAGQHIDLGSARGTLDIRAAPELQPVIEVHMDPVHPFLVAGLAVSLKLTGVTIRARYKPTDAGRTAAWPALIHSAGRVQVAHCAFEVVGPRNQLLGINERMAWDGNDALVARVTTGEDNFMIRLGVDGSVRRVDVTPAGLSGLQVAETR